MKNLRTLSILALLAPLAIVARMTYVKLAPMLGQ